MQKIPTLFLRDPAALRRVTDEVHPDCGWVLDGEGIATRKYDGWCCMVDDAGRFWKRAEVKKNRNPQPGFVEVEHDETTGKHVGWVPVGDGPEDRWFREAFDGHRRDVWEPSGVQPVKGTYELVGPKIQGNPEKYTVHILIPHHGADVLYDCPRDIAGIKAFVAGLPYEGVVWHHPGGQMAKLKAKDLK
jgi:hypothetical protein